MAKRYQHDCDQCLFVDDIRTGANWYDVYYCPNQRGGSLLARYGDEGSEYLSWPLSPAMLIRYNDGTFERAYEALVAKFKVTLTVDRRTT